MQVSVYIYHVLQNAIYLVPSGKSKTPTKKVPGSYRNFNLKLTNSGIVSGGH